MKKEVLIMACDKCGFEEVDTTLFQHVVVSEVLPPESKKKPKILSEKDLCLNSCLGAPGVNREP